MIKDKVKADGLRKDVRMPKNRCGRVFWTTSLLALATATGAMAQAPADELVVTAQKREQSVQDVPLSITAFSGQQVRELGLSRPMDLANQIPGVTMKSPNGDNSPIFTIRGIGLTDFTVSNNAATSVYVDQIIKPYYPMINFSLFDLERVEVLKGPQGTLYGRNNTGGAIKFVTRKPTSEADAFMRLDYSKFDTFEFEGAVGGQIVEGLNARLSAFTRQRSKGYQYNVYTGEENGEIDRLAGRFALEWVAADNFDALLTLHGGRNRSDVPQFKLAPPFDAVAGSPTVCAAAAQGVRARDGSCVDILGHYDPDPDIDHTQSGNAQGSGIEEDAWGASLEMNWRLPGVLVTSVTGYDEHSRFEAQDFDGTPYVVVDNSFNQDIDAFSQELRAASDNASGMHWIVGLFYSSDKLNNFQRLQSGDLFGVSGGEVHVAWEMSAKSYAAFGQVEYPFTDQWEVVGGLRYTYEERTFEGGTSSFPTAFLPTVYVENDTDVSDLSGKVGINFKPTDNALIYFSASKGFKSGGFNGAFATNPIVYTPYGPEELFAYELGAKTSFLDNRIRVNAAAFYYDWKDFQATITSIDPVTNLPVQLLTNAGDARVIGFEGDVQVRISDYVTAGFSGAYSDGEIVSGQLDGARLANNPKFNGNGIIRAEAPVEALGGALFAQGDFSYRTEYDTRIRTATTRPLVIQDGFWLVNARAGFRTDDQRLEVAFWVKNITDERFLVEVFDQGTVNSLDLYSEPRTYGVSLTYDFN